MGVDNYVVCVAQAADEQAGELVRGRAFAELVSGFWGMVYGCAAGILNDPMLAEDAVQETFVSAWKNLAKLRKPEAFPAWLRRIVVWQCCYYKRTEAPAALGMERIEDELADITNLENAIAQDDLNRRVRQLIAALPRNQARDSHPPLFEGVFP